MSDLNLDFIDQALTVLSKHKVHRFAAVGWTVEFEVAPAAPGEALPVETEDKRRCACGHDLATEHNSFGCLLCDGEKCAKPEGA